MLHLVPGDLHAALLLDGHTVGLRGLVALGLRVAVLPGLQKDNGLGMRITNVLK